jgi:uncharacterized protein (TIGR01777 family)
MKVVVAGGSGFLGHALSKALAEDGHHVAVLTRGTGGVSPVPRVRLVQWPANGGTGTWAAELDGADAAVNLAGESIAAKRWSEEQKKRIQDSRLRATRSVVEAINGASAPPPVFVSASAVGYYGPRADDIVTEETTAGVDFLARVCAKWEAEAGRAASPRTRLVIIRTGLVLDRHGGALPKMLPPFRIGVGGPVGSGHQYWPWIHLQDWVELVRWAIVTPTVSGPVNATAPNPETSADFAHYLGGAIHRPAFVPTPAFVLRFVLGEMADALLLSGQRAVPAKAQGLWFTFRYPYLDEALRAIFSEST